MAFRIPGLNEWHGATFTYGLPNMSPTKKGAKIFPKNYHLKGLEKNCNFQGMDDLNPCGFWRNAAKLSRMFF